MRSRPHIGLSMVWFNFFKIFSKLNHSGLKRTKIKQIEGQITADEPKFWVQFGVLRFWTETSLHKIKTTKIRAIQIWTSNEKYWNTVAFHIEHWEHYSGMQERNHTLLTFVSLNKHKYWASTKLKIKLTQRWSASFLVNVIGTGNNSMSVLENTIDFITPK